MDCIRDIIESTLMFFKRDNGNAVLQENVLFLKRCILKYLKMKCTYTYVPQMNCDILDICSLKGVRGIVF